MLLHKISAPPDLTSTGEVDSSDAAAQTAAPLQDLLLYPRL